MIFLNGASCFFIFSNETRSLNACMSNVSAVVYLECTNLFVRFTPLAVFISLASQVATVTRLFTFLLPFRMGTFDFRYWMKAHRGFAPPLVRSFLSSGKYRNYLRRNVIVGAEQDTIEISLWFNTYPPPQNVTVVDCYRQPGRRGVLLRNTQYRKNSKPPSPLGPFSHALSWLPRGDVCVNEKNN